VSVASLEEIMIEQKYESDIKGFVSLLIQ